MCFGFGQRSYLIMNMKRVSLSALVRPEESEIDSCIDKASTKFKAARNSSFNLSLH